MIINESVVSGEIFCHLFIDSDTAIGDLPPNPDLFNVRVMIQLNSTSSIASGIHYVNRHMATHNRGDAHNINTYPQVI